MQKKSNGVLYSCIKYYVKEFFPDEFQVMEECVKAVKAVKVKMGYNKNFEWVKMSKGMFKETEEIVIVEVNEHEEGQ